MCAMCARVCVSLEKQNLTRIDLLSPFIREPKINKTNKISITQRNHMLFSVFICFFFLHFLIHENKQFFLGQTEYNNNCTPKTIMIRNDGRLLIYLHVK